jgi:hypothetical protein
MRLTRRSLLALAVPLSRFASRVCGGSAFFIKPHPHEQRHEDYYCFGGFVLDVVIHDLSLVPVEISLEAMGESKRICVGADEHKLVQG